MKKTAPARLMFAVVAAASALALHCHSTGGATSSANVDAYPSIFPDYAGIDLPPNIAPLNFAVRQQGTAFQVALKGARGDSLVVNARKPLIRFPEKQWHALVNRCVGDTLSMEVRVLQGKVWTAYRPLRNFVAREPIDPYLVYRLLNPGYEWWSDMGIYQRDLESFRETPVIRNNAIDHACVNCHSFCRNDPSRMTLQIRKWHAGTLVCENGRVEKINTKISGTRGTAVYPSWHPDGKAIAFSVNSVIQNFPAVPGWYIEVLDTVSDIEVYDCRSHTILTPPQLSTPAFENLPAWSPDGKYLYFCSDTRPKERKFVVDDATGSMGVQRTDGAWAMDSADMYGTGEGAWVKRMKDFQYDLVRVSCDLGSNAWGPPELVLSARLTGKSISFPRVSPDGRYLMFCMSAFGYFTIHHADADLYVMDLATRNYRALDEVNSADVESFHSWSSNGRWFVFSSKRLDGVRARPFIGYFDSTGRARKPFLVPQRDPGFYSTFFMTYNVPELVTGKVPFSGRVLRDRVIGPARSAALAR